jgi:caffeoyl-CoA O-methyltransferase
LITIGNNEIVMEKKMRTNTKMVFTIALAVFALVPMSVFADGSEIFYIPKIEGIIVDGSGEDWSMQGFQVDFVASPDGRVLPPDDFDVSFRLGWEDRGLLLFVTIRDDVPVEHEDLSRLWRCDCVEVFVSQKVGATNRYQLVIASGADPKYNNTRSRLYDWRLDREKHHELSVQTASRAIEKGYAIEALFPWDNLNIKPNLGTELAFQLAANDYDGSEDSDNSLRVTWFPNVEPSSRYNFYRIKLSDVPSKALSCRADRRIQIGRCTITVRGPGNLAGDSVVIRNADTEFARDSLGIKNGRAYLQYIFDESIHKTAWPEAEIIVDGQTVAKFDELATLGHILEKYVHSLGGRAAIKKLTTRKVTGKLENDLPWNDPPVETFAFTGLAKTPYKWIAITQGFNGKEQSGFDGVTRWRATRDRIEHLGRGLIDAWLGFLLDPQGALYIQDYFPGMILKSKENLRGSTAYRIDTADTSLYFDVKTGLIIQIGSYWELQKYEEVDGVKFPFRIATSRKGGETFYAFENVQHNILIADKKLAIPDPSEVFADAFEGLEDTQVLTMLECQELTYTHEDMNVPIRDGRFLHDFILKKGYTRGLEIGTFTGYSTLWMGLAFQKTGGKIITIEIDEKYGRAAMDNFEKAGLEDIIDSRISDALEEIPRLEGTFDFVFIDAWKPDYIQYLKLLKGRVQPGGAIIAHNVTNYAQDMKDYLNAIKNDSDLETTFDTTSSEGMSISIVRKR